MNGTFLYFEIFCQSFATEIYSSLKIYKKCHSFPNTLKNATRGLFVLKGKIRISDSYSGKQHNSQIVSLRVQLISL
eukprot:m.272533 g.272533  ORF g.272533 m.272533 type:complete len:76 (+) comp16275_c0_seq1:2-229(+)